MKRKAIVPLVLGLLVGIFAVKMGMDTFKKAQAGQKIPMITAVRAIQDIAPLQELTREMIELIEVPESALLPPAERIATLEEVLGRVTLKAIPQQSPVLLSMLAPEGTPAGLVGRIPDGYRAFSVRIDEVSGVAYQIRPGDWVDVLVVMDVPSVGGRRETVSEVVLQNVQVAAIGNATAAAGGSGNTKMRPAKSATLLVKEEDAPKLHLAQTQGKITLTMRGGDGSTTDHPPSADMRSLRSGLSASGPLDVSKGWMASLMEIGSGGSPQIEPAEPPMELSPPHAVLIFHGTRSTEQGSNVERITFQNANSSTILSVAYGPPTRGVSETSGRRPGDRNSSNNRNTRNN